MHDLILSPPWYLSVIVLVVGVILFYAGNSKNQSKVRLGGIVVLLLAVVMVLLGYFVETDKEKVSRLTRELVASVPAKDWAKTSNLLDNDATLGEYTNARQLVEGAKANVDRWGVKSASITKLETAPATDGSGNFVVEINVLADTDLYKTPSTWRFTWDKTGSDWHVHRIDCLKIGDQAVDSSISKYIGK